MTIENDALKKKNGDIIIRAKEQRADYGQTSITMDISGKLGSASGEHFFTILKKQGSDFKPVFKSECKPKQSGEYPFVWNTVFSNTDSLADSSDDLVIKMIMCKYNPAGNHKKVATEETKLSELKAHAANQSDYVLGKGSNGFLIKNIKIEKAVSFLDYIFGGCEIGLQIAVDFTMSNGPLDRPMSLHSDKDNYARNQYYNAMFNVGTILQQYDSDQKIPVYGFGAKMPVINEASDCFALNGNIFAPDVLGVEGCLNVYKSTI